MSTPPERSIRRSAVREAFLAALDAVDPVTLTSRTVRRLGPWTGPVTVLALGKAAPGMASGALEALPRPPARTVVVTDREADLDGAELHLGGHPFPDGRSVEAGRALLGAAADCHGTLLVLVSGGGSALAEVPAPGLSLDDVAAVQRAVMHAGAPIEDLNLVRRRLSRLKDGGLADASPAGRVVTLVLSDVVDGGAEEVASGPTLRSPRAGADAHEVLASLGLAGSVPPEVWSRLAGPRPAVPDRPHEVEVLADGGTAASAAAAWLSRSGARADVAPDLLRGEARETARRLASRAPAGRVTVAWGETTVTVTGSGTGGRNQEGALSAALVLRGTGGVFGTFGTDGIDGPTDAAGAIVDGTTADRIEASGLDPAARLEDNDAHRALAAAGDLLRTGRTGTNVADLWIAWPGDPPISAA